MSRGPWSEASFMRRFATRHHAEHDLSRPQDEPFCRWCNNHRLEDQLGIPRYYYGGVDVAPAKAPQ